MKKYIILILFACGINITKAQNYSLSPEPIYKLNIDANLGFQSWDLKIKNNKSDSLSIHWTKLLENFPKDWDYSICDYGTCYAIIPDSSNMNKIAPGAEGFFKLDLMANGVAGYAKLLLLMSEQGSSQTPDTVGFEVTGTLAAGIANMNNNQSTLLYPNPTQNIITLQSINPVSISQLYITDMMGRPIINPTLNDKNTINVEQLKSGLFILNIVYKNGSTKNHSFIKQ